MSRSVLFVASFLTLLPLCAHAADSAPVDTRTDSTLVQPVDDGRSSARPTPPTALERTYNKAMDWSSAAAGAPAQGRVFESDKPVAPVDSAIERGGESLLNWTAEVSGDKNASNKPVNDLPRRTVKTSDDVGPKAKASNKYRTSKKYTKNAAKNDTAKTKELNMAQEQTLANTAQPQKSMQGNPIIFRDVAGNEPVNPPVTQSNQYDPHNKPVILFGGEEASAPAPLMQPSAPVGTPSMATPIDLASVPMVEVAAPIVNTVPAIESPAPQTVYAPQAPIAAPVASNASGKGITTPRIGSIPRVIIPTSPIGKY